MVARLLFGVIRKGLVQQPAKKQLCPFLAFGVIVSHALNRNSKKYIKRHGFNDKGSYATFHGQSVRETVNRLNCLGIAEPDLAAIDLVLLQKRWNKVREKQGNKEVRRVVEVAELQERNGRLHCNTLYSYDYGKDMLESRNQSIKVFEKARKSFLFDKKGWQAEIRKRKAFLKSLLGKEIELKEFFQKVNQFKCT